MTRRETWLGGHGGAVAKEPPTKVPIGSLLPADSARGALDEKHVQVLAALEDDFEPILVHRPTMRVIDGTHRLSAEVLRGRQDVTVRFFDGSEADAYVLSAQANVRHGLPLALDERRTAAARILRSHPHWSDRSIAECVGLSGKTVGRLRRCATEEIPRSHTRTGRDGTVRPVNSAQGRLLAARLMAADPGASLRELARLAGVSTATVRDVRDRVLRGEGPVPTGRTAAGKEPSPGTPPTVPRPAGAVYRCDAPATDTVRRLVKDPSLKGSEPGRLLLRTLLATEISEQQWREIAAALPDHCAPLVRAAAARRAADWAALAGAVSRGASGAA